MNAFAPQTRRAAHAYSAVNIATMVPSASPHGLILMLFDGAIQAVGIAQSECEAGRIEAKNKATAKALSIIEEGLRASLDRHAGGELAERLDSLYSYMNRRLLKANLHNAIEQYAEVGKLLAGMRSTWAEIESGRSQLANAA